MELPRGIIFDIKKFSIHDGPGIRTTVFLKGCPLHCLWCHNPEGISYKSEIHFFENRCIGCQDCVDACLNQALMFDGYQRIHDAYKCRACGSCAEVCPAEAAYLVGTPRTVQEVMDEIMTDLIYYDQSGGGVTFSGGEPLGQIEFLLALLTACQDNGIHTALDTCGHVPYEQIERVRPLVNLFLYDIKVMDSERHMRYTGVPNHRILENLTALSRSNSRVIARIPIIPGVNDDDENLNQTGLFLASLSNIQDVSILPYHRTATDKYRRMKANYQLIDLTPPTENRMIEIAESLEMYGLTVNIGG